MTKLQSDIISTLVDGKIRYSLAEAKSAEIMNLIEANQPIKQKVLNEPILPAVGEGVTIAITKTNNHYKAGERYRVFSGIRWDCFVVSYNPIELINVNDAEVL